MRYCVSVRVNLGQGRVFACLCVLAMHLNTEVLGEADTVPAEQTKSLERATFGGGCFWCLEAVFECVPGVRSVINGYAGGNKPNPTYKEVCSGLTGHAEVVQIEFDPRIISYEELLEIFWRSHDPTTLNRQGPDVGTQYRSIILYHNETQLKAASRSMAAIAKRLGRPIVTELKPLTAFYPAENYHQDYYRNNPEQPYCRTVIRPKLDKVGEYINALRAVKSQR